MGGECQTDVTSKTHALSHCHCEFLSCRAISYLTKTFDETATRMLLTGCCLTTHYAFTSIYT